MLNRKSSIWVDSNQAHDATGNKYTMPTEMKRGQFPVDSGARPV